MKLVERLGRSAGGGAAADAGATDAPGDLAAVAARLHDQIIDRLDLAQIMALDPADMRERLRLAVTEVVSATKIVVSASERDALAQRIMNEIVGLGPLEELLADPGVSDILVNGHDQIWVERQGLLSRTTVRFRNQDHLLNTIRRMVARVGRRIDESSPMVDARLPDGSRINAIVPPLGIDGPLLSIRRFGVRPLRAEDLLRTGALGPEMLRYLRAVVHSRCTVLVSGGTGTGKTTLLNVLSSFIPSGERIITIEDAAELSLQQPHVARLEARPANVEGQGEVAIRDLVRNALRMRPDRIVIGEVRGPEVFDMLQAMNTGHEGSLTTLHANSAVEALARLMTMMSMANTTFSESTMAQIIAQAVDVIVHLARLPDGRRVITSVVEVLGHKGPEIQTQEVYAFRAQGVAPSGAVLGRFSAAAPSTFQDRFRASGVPLEAAP